MVRGWNRFMACSSCRLGNHCDRARRTLLDAQAAALAVVQVDRVLVGRAGAELDHRVVRADAVAVVAGEAVAARHAAARLEERVGRVEATDDLVEGRLAPRAVELRPDGL